MKWNALNQPSNNNQVSFVAHFITPKISLAKKYIHKYHDERNLKTIQFILFCLLEKVNPKEKNFKVSNKE